MIQFTYTGPIDLTSSLPNITSPMTINGPGASLLNIRRSGSATTEFRLLAVNSLDSGEAVTIRGLTLSGARADNFAGAGLVVHVSGIVTLDSVVLSDNRALGAAGQGGGIYIEQGEVHIQNSTLTGNQAVFGGGILAAIFGGVQGVAKVVNSTITGNSATDFGGGIYTNAGQVTILSSTIVGNVGGADDTGGGGGTYNGGASATAFNVADTLYASNQVGTSSPVADQCGGAHTSFGYNLRETNDAGCTGFTSTGDIVNASPMIGSLAANGGPTPTIALLTGSPAIDAGNPATPGSGAFPICPADDQRGLLRGGTAGVCDVGAFEVGATEPQPPPGQTPSPVTSTPGFDLAAAIKKCKKKFPKGPKRKKCIKRAKRLA